MPRKDRNQPRIKRMIAEDEHLLKVLPESAKKYERNKALAALKAAKKLEAKRIEAGYWWYTDGKTRRLVKSCPSSCDQGDNCPGGKCHRHGCYSRKV